MKTPIKELPKNLLQKAKETDWKALGLKIVQAVWAFLKRLGLRFWDMLKHVPYFFHVTIHPFDGFFRLKNEPKRHSVGAAVFLYAVLAISALINRQMVNYLFTDVTLQLKLNVVTEVLKCLLPYMLWVIANWCFTSLMDGAGKLSDVFCATAVAVIPMILCNLIMTPVSYMMAFENAQLYQYIFVIAQVLTYLLMFIGMMITHQYTVGKAIVTAILTVLGMLIISFVALLVLYLIQQLVGFISSLSAEITFRMNE